MTTPSDSSKMGYQIKLIAVDVNDDSKVFYDPQAELVQHGYGISAEVFLAQVDAKQYRVEWALYRRCETGEAEHIADYLSHEACADAYRELSRSPATFLIMPEFNLELPYLFSLTFKELVDAQLKRRCSVTLSDCGVDDSELPDDETPDEFCDRFIEKYDLSECADYA